MIHLYEDDKRKNDPDFSVNHGSFSSIHLNLNRELKKLGFYAEEGAADWHGFSTGLGLNFGLPDWKRFAIHVWETNVLPDPLLDFIATQDHSRYRLFSLSKQISDVWLSYGLNSPVIDIGVDENFYFPLLEEKKQKFKFDHLFKTSKFVVTSVTSLNFRSGFASLCDAILLLDPTQYRFIIKNTDDRDAKVRMKIADLQSKGYDIHYICERMSSLDIREIYQRSDLLTYCVEQTSAGLPLLEAAACGCPTITGDFCPTNIYPSTNKVKVIRSTIAAEKEKLCEEYGLPYTFPLGWVNESAALFYKVDIEDLARNIMHAKINQDYYAHLAYVESFSVREAWSWKHSARKLVKKLYGDRYF